MAFLLVSYKLEAIIVAAVTESLETAGITGFEPVSLVFNRPPHRNRPNESQRIKSWRDLQAKTNFWRKL